MSSTLRKLFLIVAFCSCSCAQIVNPPTTNGTVTSVSGTTNQVSVATGTTTPVISLPSTLIAPGTIAATTSTASPFFLSTAADPADAGVIRLGNAELIAWESNPTGTDITVTVNSSNQFVFSAAILSPTFVTPVLGAATATSVSSATYSTATNCASGASPATCGSASAGRVAVPTGANPTLVVNTSAVTANSEIFLAIDETFGASLSVTCNTTLTTLVQPVVTARTAGTSFTIQIGATLVTNPACVGYHIVN